MDDATRTSVENILQDFPPEQLRDLISDFIAHQDLGRVLNRLTSQQLKSLINGLATTKDMEEEMSIGTSFLKRLLDEDGVEEFVDFIEKKTRTLDNEGKFLKSDFTPRQWRLLNTATIRNGIMTRRMFFGSLAWGAEGMALIVKHPARTLGYKEIADYIDNRVEPVTETLLGAALLYEMIYKWKESKLRETANAVGELAWKAQQQSRNR